MSDHFIDNRLSGDDTQEAFYTGYRRTFSIVRAQSAEETRACFRLRHLVYVQENGYEDPALYMDGLECDYYDAHAVHYMLVHNETGDLAGTVRVILPDDDRPENSFPMQDLCDHPVLHSGDRSQIFCQVSRMCMHPNFRRRDGDGKVLPTYFEQEDLESPGHDGNTVFIRRRIPYAPLGLFQAAFETALKHRITDCLMFIEPNQLSHFNRMGISYSTLGPRVPYHGQQQPIVFNIKNVLDTMLIDNPQCWDVISDMGRVHKMANNLYLNDWQDYIMDGLDWDQILNTR